MIIRFISFSLLVFIVAVSPLVKDAGADNEGIAGRLVGLQIVDPGSDTHSKFRGSIFIKENFGIVQEYKWSGSTCTGTISIADSDIANFSRLLNSRPIVRLIPIYKNGQGGSRCIKRYIMFNRFFADDIEFTVD